MSKKTAKRRGGWPGRESTKFVLRLEPSVAAGLADLAAEVGLSRNQYIELWLSAIVEQYRLFTELGELAPSLNSVFVELGLARARREKHEVRK